MVAMTDEIPTGKLRLFVAIAIPEPVRNEMVRVQRELDELTPPGAVRWTKPEQFHLTLKFLGGVPTSRVDELEAAIGAVCANARPLRLRAAGVGFFPNARAPRVIWAGITDTEGQLAGVQGKIERAVRPFAAEPGPEHFVGHLTLGRMKDRRNPRLRELANRAPALENQQFGEWTAEEVKLVRSELFPEGARHTPLAAFPLSAILEA
jgi:RNA 2',3'-cyclic 3'-phosphodiesterase